MKKKLLVNMLLTAGFILGAAHVCVAQNRSTKLIMRLGEERVLEDGLKVTLTKGEGDLIVVTLIRGENISREGTIDTAELARLAEGTPSKIKLGRYNAMANIRVTFSRFPSVTLSEEVTISITSTDREGNLKGQITHNLGTGPVTGRIDSSGIVRLDGVIVGRAEWLVALTARFDGESLRNGKFIFTDTSSTKGVATGEFNIATRADN